MTNPFFGVALTAAILAVSQSPATAADADIILDSGATEVPLVELYTSEGCSSCPPADRWLSELDTDPALWQEFTPIAFHVDYWDDLGWKDRFASRAFSDRQRRYAVEGGVRVMYTPGVFRAGEEWTGWRDADAPFSSDRIAGPLRLDIRGNRVEARFEPASEHAGELTLHVAVLGMDLETRVRAGENRGKTLTHDFVALGMASVVLEPTVGGYRASARLPNAVAGAVRQAIAAWITSADRQAPIQSVGGFLPRHRP